MAEAASGELGRAKLKRSSWMARRSRPALASRRAREPAKRARRAQWGVGDDGKSRRRAPALTFARTLICRAASAVRKNSIVRARRCVPSVCLREVRNPPSSAPSSSQSTFKRSLTRGERSPAFIAHVAPSPSRMLPPQCRSRARPVAGRRSGDLLSYPSPCSRRSCRPWGRRCRCRFGARVPRSCRLRFAA